MRGLCKDTYLDTQYAIKYDPENIITYMGIERNVITYDFVKKMWQITVIPTRYQMSEQFYQNINNHLQDMTNPYIKGVSKATKHSFALGTQVDS